MKVARVPHSCGPIETPYGAMVEVFLNKVQCWSCGAKFVPKSAQFFDEDDGSIAEFNEKHKKREVKEMN